MAEPASSDAGIGFHRYDAQHMWIRACECTAMLTSRMRQRYLLTSRQTATMVPRDPRARWLYVLAAAATAIQSPLPSSVHLSNQVNPKLAYAHKSSSIAGPPTMASGQPHIEGQEPTTVSLSKHVQLFESPLATVQPNADSDATSPIDLTMPNSSTESAVDSQHNSSRNTEILTIPAAK